MSDIGETSYSRVSSPNVHVDYVIVKVIDYFSEKEACIIERIKWTINETPLKRFGKRVEELFSVSVVRWKASSCEWHLKIDRVAFLDNACVPVFLDEQTIEWRSGIFNERIGRSWSMPVDRSVCNSIGGEFLYLANDEWRKILLRSVCRKSWKVRIGLPEFTHVCRDSSISG